MRFHPYAAHSAASHFPQILVSDLAFFRLRSSRAVRSSHPELGRKSLLTFALRPVLQLPSTVSAVPLLQPPFISFSLPTRRCRGQLQPITICIHSSPSSSSPSPRRASPSSPVSQTPLSSLPPPLPPPYVHLLFKWRLILNETTQAAAPAERPSATIAARASHVNLSHKTHWADHTQPGLVFPAGWHLAGIETLRLHKHTPSSSPSPQITFPSPRLNEFHQDYSFTISGLLCLQAHLLISPLTLISGPKAHVHLRPHVLPTLSEVKCINMYVGPPALEREAQKATSALHLLFPLLPEGRLTL